MIFADIRYKLATNELLRQVTSISRSRACLKNDQRIYIFIDKRELFMIILKFSININLSFYLCGLLCILFDCIYLDLKR